MKPFSRFCRRGAQVRLPRLAPVTAAPPTAGPWPCGDVRHLDEAESWFGRQDWDSPWPPEVPDDTFVWERPGHPLAGEAGEDTPPPLGPRPYIVQEAGEPEPDGPLVRDLYAVIVAMPEVTTESCMRQMAVLVYPPFGASREQWAAWARQVSTRTGTRSELEHPGAWPTCPPSPAEPPVTIRSFEPRALGAGTGVAA